MRHIHHHLSITDDNYPSAPSPGEPFELEVQYQSDTHMAYINKEFQIHPNESLSVYIFFGIPVTSISQCSQSTGNGHVVSISIVSNGRRSFETLQLQSASTFGNS